MKTKLTVRYLSNRTESFEVEMFPGKAAGLRLKEFAQDPTLVLQTESELVVIPSSAIECLTISTSQADREQLTLDNVRKAKRLK